MQIYLLDGYLDEPSCLGVPPYISPHIRYTWGALLHSGFNDTELTYLTIDQFRTNKQKYLQEIKKADLFIIIAGTTVPGNYLGGQPISLTEIKKLGEKIHKPKKILGGPITLVIKKLKKYDHVCEEITALQLYKILTGKNISSPKNIEKHIAHWAVRGAKVTRKHPEHPHLICEIETFRGCPRSGHCHFCSEQLKKIHYQRKPLSIIREVKALANQGNHYYRLGCQTDLLSYQHHKNSQGELIPNPQAIKKLYQGIRKADPELQVLHMDNINPATIVKYPYKSKNALEIIAQYNTTGDTAAFGLESADPKVIKKNNIETDPETALKAIKIINKICGFKKQGIPALLPGLNFLHGLKGERKETMNYNYNFLKKIIEKDLLLRRINIRQVIPIGNYSPKKINKNKFKNYKKKINNNINRPMLKKVFPRGTIIRKVRTESHKGKTTFGRPPGTYPILVGIPGKLKLNQYINVKVIDHGYRSVTALPWPLKINKASIEQLTAFPGIGKKRAHKIFLQQPETAGELKKILGNSFPFSRWKNWFIY